MPLQKWKLILTNWINCYFNEKGFSHITQQKVNIDALLNIILHLRENLGLDESKSSILEAQTLQEFIAEKYPEFTFENGTVDVSTDDEIYVAASLLLFFVCVNSKDIDIKNAMCSKLCVEDQQVIMKFSKALMECPSVTIRDVQSAIVEACGQDTVTVEQCDKVPETPPVLRSLHSEVRRLQAALDAERFDKNFLQEELTRTNSKLEKLLEDKEKYKKDVVSLKAKISNCCGQESQGQSLSEAAQNTNAKLTRQLEEMEERLVETQMQLDEAIYERNIYKAKVDGLKLECDKWFKLSEEERTLVGSLSGQLQSEQQNNAALRELVAELRQHNHHNRLDGSLLECDDPDASMHSLSRNMSVCNEVCANVVEVQLSEERAKIYELKQHIDKLQEQLQLLEENTNIEKIKSFNLVSSKDTEIENLKHQINIEIEKQIQTTETFCDKTSKLNNKINELEQELKDNNDSAHIALQVKVQEIQILKDEKKKLSQCMLDETSMLENKVKEMDYDMQALRGELMNKEQNIKKLQEQLKLLEETTNVEKIKLNTEIENLKQQINKEIDKQIHTTETFNDKTSKLNNKIIELEQELKDNNDSAHIALQVKLQEIQLLNDEKMLLSQRMLDETSMLENKVKEMDYNMQALRGELTNKEENIKKLQEQLKFLEETANMEKTKLFNLVSSKDTDIENLKHQIKKEIEKQIHTTQTLNNENTKLNNKINELEQEIKDNNDSAHIALEVKVQEVQVLKEEKILLSQRMLDETSMLENKLKQMDSDVQALRGELMNKEQNIEKLQEQLILLEETNNVEKIKSFNLVSSKDSEIENLKHQINIEIEKQIHTTETFHGKISNLNNKINELEQDLKDNNYSANIALQLQVQEIQILKDEKMLLSQRMLDETSMLENKVKEMDYDIQTFRGELLTKQQNTEILQEQLKLLEETTNIEKIELNTEIQNLKDQVNKEMEKQIQTMETFNYETSKLNNKINELEHDLKEKSDSAYIALQVKVKEIQGLKDQKELLSQHMSDETNMLEKKINELDNDMQTLRSELLNKEQNIEMLQKQLKLLKETTNIEKIELNTEIQNLKDQVNTEMEKQIHTTETFNDETTKLNNKINELEHELKEKTDSAYITLQVKVKEIQVLKDEKELLSQRMSDETNMLEKKINELDNDMQTLRGELLNKEQNIEMLQKQLKLLKETTNIEKIELNTEIQNLKDQVNTEMEKQIHTTETFNDETTKLNNKINELEHELKEKTDSAYITLQVKVKEIQVLKDEKELLSQRMSDETNMLEKKINELDNDMQTLRGELLNKEQNIEMLKRRSKLLEETTNVEKIELNTEIQNLKDQVITEMEKQIHTTETFHDETTKLYNKINELEHELKEKSDSAYITLQVKVKEIQVLKDEKELLSQRMSDETNMLEKKINELDNDMQTLRGELLNKEQNIEMLQKQLKLLEETTNIEKVKLNTEIQNLKDQVNTEMEKQFHTTETFNEENIELNNKINALEHELKEKSDSAYITLQVKVEEITVLKYEKELLSQRMSDETNMLEKKINELDSEMQTLRGELLNKEQNIESLHEQLKLLEETTDNVKIKLDTEIKDLKDQINKDMEEQIHTTETFNNEASKLNNKIIQLEQELKEKSDSTYITLQVKVKEIQVLKDEKELLSQRMSDETNMLEKKINELDNDMQTLRGELLNKEQNTETLQEQIKLLEEATNIEKIELNTEIQNLKDQVNKEMTKHIHTTETFSNETSKLNNKINELEQELKEKNDSAYIALQLKVKEIQVLKDEKELLSQHMSDETNMLEKKINELDNDMQILRGELLNKEQNIQMLQKQLKLLEETTNIEKIELNTEIQNLKDQIHTEMEKQIHTTETSNDETSKLNNKINELEHELKEKTDSAYIALQVKVEEIQILKDEKELLSQCMSDETNMLEKKINELDDDMQTLRGDRGELLNKEQHIETLQEQLKLLKETTNFKKIELDTEIQNLKDQMNKDMEKQIQTMESFNYETSNLNNKINELEQELKEKSDSAYIALEAKVKEIEVLKNEKELISQHMSDETNMLGKRIWELDNDMQTLRGELLNKEQTIEMLHEQLKLLEETTNIEKMKLDTEIQNLKDKINKETEEQILTRESFNDETSKLNKKINELEQELKEKNDSAYIALQAKDKEIQVLKDEKELLSQHMADETNMLANKVKEMDNEIMQALRGELMDKEQNIQILQEQLKLLEETTNIEKLHLVDLVSSKDTEIVNLKHQINKEIEKLIHTTETFNDETSKLSNKINELEQELKDNNTALQVKVQEVQVLKDEKMLLAQRMSDETNILENKIKEMDNYTQALKGEMNKEQNTKLQMKENYENQYMNLRERIWNRNNELVELQNNMETTDRHLRKCSEKQLMLQKERDRLSKVSKINETEIINIKKYLAELSDYFKTFSSAKDLYNKKLVGVVSLQRRVRKEILELEGHTSDAVMCGLERGHSLILQDLAECAMNMERWAERCIRRAVSPEKIMQAFTSDYAPLSVGNFPNTSLEVQLEMLENNLQKLLEELNRARNDDAAKAQAETVMEVRAEYEDKLNRMKTKMKLLYQDQITKFHEKQKEEIARYQKELEKTREQMVDSSRAYENHIKGLTTELWNVGEKLLIKNEEADWLRRKRVSGSLMSLQHVHSSGFVPAPEDRPHRPSDTHSLRSLPVQNKKPEGRTLHMSDEEGEVFDNRFLAELTATPRAPARSHHRPSSPSAPAPGPRLSELRWRNSLCPPHLKSSYPAETQFAPTLDEDDIKCVGGTMSRAGARKEVGITAYKKPGPPTPSKQAGRLSATDSELRESLRPEPEPPRKTSTPARIARMLFRYSRNDTDNASTPHKRMSIFRSKK